MSITPEMALERLHHANVAEAARWGMSDEQPNMCRDIVQERIAELEAALAAERQTATLNAETHTRAIRALEDMVEAEAEARREAEGECERLRAYAREVGTALVRLTCDGSEFYRKAGDVFEVDPAACSAWVRRSRQTKHETIMRLTNQKNELQAELSKLRRGAEPPAPPPVPTSSQT